MFEHSPGEDHINVIVGEVHLRTGTYRLLIDNEILQAGTRSGTSVPVTRATEGTTAAAHSTGAAVEIILTAAGIAQMLADVAAAAAALYARFLAELRVTHATTGPVILTSWQRVLGDVSGGALPTIKTPVAPGDNDRVGFVNSGGDVSGTPAVFTASVGQTIEDPSAAPGTFSATATMHAKSGAYEWFYDLANTRWKLLGASSSAPFIIDLVGAVQSSGNDGTAPRRIGGRSFNPADYASLSGSSSIILHVLLETTNTGNAANLQLLRFSGAGSPTVLATASSSSATCVEVTVDVSSFFRPGQAAGIFLANLYLATASITDFATCSGAWLQVSP